MDGDARMPIALRWLLTVLVLGATPHKGLTAMRGALRTFAAATRNAPAVRARQDLPRRGAPRAPRQARSAPRLDAEQPPTREYRGVTDRTKPKRKVCVHLGFIGSNYRGMLFQNDPAIPTVERELLRALRDWGAILPENADQPTKVGWQRASRTDKGVHAIGAAVSCKLLLADEQLEELAVTERVLGGFGGLGLSTSAADTPPAPSPPPPHPGAIGAPAGGTGGAPPGMVTVVNAPQLAALNELLPKDIRIFSIQRTRGGFDSCARHSAPASGHACARWRAALSARAARGYCARLFAPGVGGCSAGVCRTRVCARRAAVQSRVRAATPAHAGRAMRSLHSASRARGRACVRVRPRASACVRVHTHPPHSLVFRFSLFPCAHF